MIRSCASPHSSASAAERIALCTIASIVTSRASSGSERRAFSSISSVRSCWSRLPQFTPMRTGFRFASATSMMVRKFSSRRFAPTLPGLIRYLASASAMRGYFVSRRWPL